MAGIDVGIIILYFIVILGIGVYFSNKDKDNTDQYFLANRNLGWFVIGASLFASNIGSEHLVGLAESGFKRGLIESQFEILAAFMLLTLGWVFVPFYNRSGVKTMPEFLEKRFSPSARMYLSVVSIISYVITKISVTIFAGAIVFESLLGIDFWTGALIVVIVTGLYTVLGGLKAVIYTDTVQMFLLIGGSILITIFGLSEIGGWEPMVMYSGDGFMNLWRTASNSDYPWTAIIYGAPILGVWYWCTDQFIVQRVLAARNITVARKATIFSGFLKITPMFIFVIPGIIAYALTQDVNSSLNIEDSGATLPELIKHLLPVGVRGLVAAGILSALMSSLSSVFNSCSTLITIDIYKKFRPKEKEQKLVRVGQIATGILVIIGLLWIPFQESLSKGGLFKYIQNVQAYISPPIAAVFLFGLFFKRINSSGAMSALYLGAFLGLNRLVLEIDASYVGSNLSGILPWFVNMHFLHFALFLFIVCSLTMFIISYMTPKPDYKKIADVVYNKNDKEDNNSNKKLDKKLSLLLCFVVLAIWSIFSTSESPSKVTSPDNSLALNIDYDRGRVFYSLEKDGKKIINNSMLGIETSHFSFSDKLSFRGVDHSSYNEDWTQVWGEQKVITDEHNEMIIKVKAPFDDKYLNMNIRFRAFDDGVAFRYEIPEQEGINDFSVLDELTEFNFAEDSKSWWIPAYAYRRYEFLYANTLISEISRDKFSELVENLNPPRIGPEAVQTPFTVQREDGITIAIHEANLANYSSMTLKANGTSNMECDLIPWSDGVKVRAEKSLITPWRTIIVGDSPSEITMSTLTLNLNEPNKIEDTSWINPGKYIGVWWEMIGTNQSSWGSGPYHGATTDKVKKYIDFGSKYGFDGLLVEGWNTGWDENWCCTGDGGEFDFYHPHPDFNDVEVAKYAKEKGIRIVGHHETGTQIRNYESQLDSAFAYCKRNGIRVVKTGYVNDGSQNIKRIDDDGIIHKEWHHGQYMVEHFRKVLETAAKYNVGIVVHEPIKDTGLRRTYPNMLSREGARGQEFNGFMPKDWNNKPNHTTILPFTRLLSSPMDYTPGIFNLKDYRYYSQDNRQINPDHHIPSTISKELALYVVIYAPVQMAADLPEHYEAHLDAFEFILDVPTDWENTITLNGEIGEYITVVRKDINSNDWYLGSITNEDSRDIEINLSFLDPGLEYSATIYKDPKDGGWESKPEQVVIETKIVKNSDDYKIVLPAGGGQAIKFSPIK